MLTNDCFKLLPNSPEDDQLTSNVKLWARDTKGLVHLALGELKSAESLFDGYEDLELKKDSIENASLSGGEFYMPLGNSQRQRIFMRRLSIHLTQKKLRVHVWHLLIWLQKKFCWEPHVHYVNFCHIQGSHPKVGVVLTCIAMMFKQKARLEALSSILIQESVTPNLSLGTEIFWLGHQRKSGIGFATRYNTDKMVGNVVNETKNANCFDISHSRIFCSQF